LNRRREEAPREEGKTEKLIPGKGTKTGFLKETRFLAIAHILA
jgi:hypothetical protein